LYLCLKYFQMILITWKYLQIYKFISPL